MVSPSHKDLLPGLEAWLQRTPAVRAAALFGSRARTGATAAPADGWSDVDVHLIVTAPDKIIATDWRREMPGYEFCLQVIRPVSGGMRKLSVLFAEGEADLVLVPQGQMRLGRLGMTLGLHRKIAVLRRGLNAFATPMSYGYRFLKGERSWGAFYARVVAEMEGYRLDEKEVRELADAFLAEQLYLLQKLGRGEQVVAQRVLHRSLNETCIVLLHELKMRRGELSIQQARRVEQLVAPEERWLVQVSARLDTAELAAAAWRARSALDWLMAQLVPAWQAPAGMEALLARYKSPGSPGA